MKSLIKSCVFLACIVTAGFSASKSFANLVITEAMSSSGGDTPDWFELTNFGATAIDITSYRVDDNSASFALSLPLTGITTIAPNESVVFMETNAPLTAIPAFRTFWSNLSPSIQVGSYTGSGIGLSSAGDAVNVFDATPTPGNLIATNAFGAATTGVSFEFTANNSLATLSVSGINGAYTVPGGTPNVGSPGVTAVPEPTTIALLGVAGILGLAARRRMSSN
ncbi:MAG: lamin tail domain-containing protein [Planctomycetota bacterium]|nr:lamin tail domain-containing protein [Planctomycetota bacterium]